MEKGEKRSGPGSPDWRGPFKDKAIGNKIYRGVKEEVRYCKRGTNPGPSGRGGKK